MVISISISDAKKISQQLPHAFIFPSPVSPKKKESRGEKKEKKTPHDY